MTSVWVCHLWPFDLILIVQLSNRNPYFHRFRCHHPLITQLNFNYWNNCNYRTWWSLWREKWAVWNLRRRSNVLELPKVSGMFSEDVWMFWRPSMYLVCAIDFRNFSKFVISFAFGEEFCDTLPLMLVLFLFSIARDSLQKIQWNQSHLDSRIWIKLINFTRYWKCKKIRKYLLKLKG